MPSERPVVIRAQGLGKEYPLGLSRPGGTLRDLLASTFRRRRRPSHAAHPSGRTHWALRDVDLEIREGEILGLVGANGAGKSTLLKILSRIVYPSTGWAEVRGRVGSLLEVGTGFHPELTGRENVYLSGALLGMRRDEIRQQFEEIVAFAEVQEYIDTPVKHYSSGMYLRLGFAVAAHLKPEILMVDEVLAVGDVGFQRKCLGKMSQVSDSGRTVIFVSHNMAAVTRLCSRAYWLHRGQVRLAGDAREVVSAYLNEMAPGVPHREWGEDGPGDADIRLLAVSVAPSGDVGAGAPLTQDRALDVKIRYRVLRALPDCNVGLEVKSGDGTTVFSSFDSDLGGTDGQPRAAGVFSATCSIPGGLLNEGRYTLSFVGGIPFVTLAFRVDDALSIEISPALPAAGQASRLPVRRPGVVAPRLHWATNTEASGGAALDAS